MSDKRQISPEELEFVFRLATTYPDLRVIEKDLAELSGLRQRVARGEAAFKALATSQVALRQAVASVLRKQGAAV